jgi:hypothetical protein
MYGALSAFGGLKEFYQRFCAVPGLPTFLPSAEWTEPLHSPDPKSYFVNFYRKVFPHLATMSAAQINALKWRRMVQMRAYYAMQVRWLLGSGSVVAKGMTTVSRRKAVQDVDSYLEGLQGLLNDLANATGPSVLTALSRLDKTYNKTVRATCLACDVWAGHRWLIAPRRAGGLISLNTPFPIKDQVAKNKLSQVVTYLVEELTAQLAACKTEAARGEVFKHIVAIAALGVGSSDAATTRRAVNRLKAELRKPHALAIWSLPLASFDPVKNRYRELLFSYQ